MDEPIDAMLSHPAPSHRARPRRYVLALACASAPTLLALTLLVAGGWLAFWPAAIAGAGVILGLALLLRRHLAHLEAVTEYIRSMAGDGRGEGEAGRVKAPPLPEGPGLPALTFALRGAAAETGRAWRARRRELEAAAAANERILASLPDPLILLDDERRILRVNPAAEALLGSRLTGRDLIAVLRNPPLIEAVDGVLAGGPGRFVEFSLPVPVERVFGARIEPLANPMDAGVEAGLHAPATDGAAALIALHDVTRIKHADQMRADFVANASHELRTPLSTLLGFIETLRGPARDDAEARDRFLGIMHEQASRMARLVADLLSLSRIELNEHSPPAGRVALSGILASVVDTLQLKAAGKGMSIVLAPDLAELPPVVGDADELAQVFQNLIDNAVKYGRDGTAVRVTGRFVPAGSAAPRIERRGQQRSIPASRRLPDAVAIAIADEGEGIPREHLLRLTERFYRVDTARSRDLGGTGLGLAIVKHIVNRHRGALEIDSAVGEGSTFTVYLPAATEPAAVPKR